MNRLSCEICGCNEIRKQDGVFVCQGCGCQYDVEEVRKMMSEEPASTPADKNADVERLLALAHSSKDSGNNEKAEDYATQVLNLDEGNYEAWYIKGFAIGWQASISNDRSPEAFSCFNKVLHILAELPIEQVTERNVALLEEMKDHIEKITLARCDLYTNPFRIKPNKLNTSYIIDNLSHMISAYGVMLQNIATGAEAFIEKAKASENPESLEASVESLQALADGARHSIGSIYFNGARKINESAMQSFNDGNEKWEKMRVFDYFGTGNHDLSAEKDAFVKCSLAFEHMIKVLENAIFTMKNEWVPAYIEYHNELIDMSQAKEEPLALFDSEPTNEFEKTTRDAELYTFYDNRVTIAEADLNHRTNRRYYNQNSTGRITHDGFFYDDSVKAAKRKEIEVFKYKRDEYAPEKESDMWE